MFRIYKNLLKNISFKQKDEMTINEKITDQRKAVYERYLTYYLQKERLEHHVLIAVVGALGVLFYSTIKGALILSGYFILSISIFVIFTIFWLARIQLSQKKAQQKIEYLESKLLVEEDMEALHGEKNNKIFPIYWSFPFYSLILLILLCGIIQNSSLTNKTKQMRVQILLAPNTLANLERLAKFSGATKHEIFEKAVNDLAEKSGCNHNK